jgi:hypothetical protein
MTQEELVHRIQILCPNANFSSWPLTGDYFGDVDPIEVCGYRICWSTLNTTGCPSEVDILAVTKDQLDRLKQDIEDNNLVAKYQNDLAIKLAYQNTKISNTDLTFIKFLHQLQRISV